MDMQGNELDELFRSSLDELEIQPSAQVWTGITKQLDADKRKRSWKPFLSIAAGILLAIIIGVLFMPKQVKTNNPHPLANRVITIAKAPEVLISQQPNKTAATAVIAPINHFAAVKVELKDKAAKLRAKSNALPKTNDGQPIVSEERGDDLASAVITNNTNNEITKPITHDLSILADKPQPATLLAEKEDKPVKAPVKKRRIHSVGDLFNVVIAAVDKRKDKVIEFSNTDEDDAVITGINLGIIKVKKEK